MTALGIDIGGVEDVDPSLNFTSARQTVAESVMGQLLHDPGLLWWSPTIGYNLRQHLHQPADPDRIEREIIRQAELDERVQSATCDVTSSAKGDAITVVVNLVLIQESAEDVEFTLTVSEFQALSTVAL